MTAKLVFEDKYFQVISPEFPLNCRDASPFYFVIDKWRLGN